MNGEKTTPNGWSNMLNVACALQDAQKEFQAHLEGRALMSKETAHAIKQARELLLGTPANAPERINDLEGKVCLLEGEIAAAHTTLNEAGAGMPNEERELSLSGRITELVKEHRGADQSWQAAEAFKVHISQLLGVDYTCPEPETCEQVIERWARIIETAKVLAAKYEGEGFCETPCAEAVAAVVAAVCMSKEEVIDTLRLTRVIERDRAIVEAAEAKAVAQADLADAWEKRNRYSIYLTPATRANKERQRCARVFVGAATIALENAVFMPTGEELVGFTPEQKHHALVEARDCSVCVHPGPRDACLGAPKECFDGDNGNWSFQSRETVRYKGRCRYFEERKAVRVTGEEGEECTKPGHFPDGMWGDHGEAHSHS